MARNLPLSLDEISLGNTAKIQPAWQVLLYDIRSGENTVSDVVTGATLALQTGPEDITSILISIKISERAGDYITSGVASSVVTGTCVDADGLYDPDLVIEDPDALGRFFRRGNVVRIRLGDERVAPSDWVNVFTGRIAGQAGYSVSRPGLRSEISFKAYGREATFLPFERTSSEFKNDGTSYFDMAEAIAGSEMGLDIGEVNFFGFGTNLLRHASVTLARENPLSMIAKIMFIDGFLPKFDGSGILTQTSGLVSSNSDRFYDTDDGILSISRPQTEIQPADSVCVVGLDFNLTRVDQPTQLIAELNVTTGYFTNGEDLEIYWSDDKTKLADSVVPLVLKSVNGGLSALGGGETFFPIASPSTNSVGTIGYRVTIDTGFAPWISVFLLVTYVTLSAIPDFTIPLVGTVTIPAGRIVQAAALAGAMIIMTKLGRGQYQYIGKPFEFVYQELRECAVVDGVGEFERNEIEVENHLVDNTSDARTIAREQLFRQQARGRPRNVTMLHDMALEPDDTFELLSSGRRFLVDTITYTLQRGAQQIASNVSCFEVTDNVSRAT